MPFPTTLSAPQKATLRASGYWSRNLVALCDNAVVFRAKAAETIDSQPFIAFDYDDVEVGAYTDVWEGMVAYLSPTTNIRDAHYRGRVRLAPSSTQFFIDENAEIITSGVTYIIVVRDTDLFARIRRDTLVDGSIPYHPLPPQLNGLPTVVVLYDDANTGTVTYTPSQTGIPVDTAATTVDTWAWDISGAGASSIDDDTAQHPDITLEAGYHYLLRVIYTDDNGQSNYQIVHVYAITRTFSAPVVQPVVAGSITGDLEDGWTASLTAYADVSTLIDRTHCVVFHVERFGDNSSTPIVSNVLMNGRIRSDSLQTQGSLEAGRIHQVTFAVEGLTAYLRRLRIPNDIVRPVASPDEWGEAEIWTPYSMAVYAMWTYSTLTNITSFGVETGAFESYAFGGEPRGIDGGMALDVLQSLLWDTIKAAPNFAPSGDMRLAIHTSYRQDRSGVPTITTLELQDMRDYTVDRDSSRTTAQVIAFGGVYDSAANAYVLYTAQAPTIVYGDGGEERELTREILTVDSNATDAADELGARASNEFAFQNPKPLLRTTLFDSYAGVMTPTNDQRWVATIPASSNTLGIAYGASDYWQLQSVTLTLNTDGSIDTVCEMPAETAFDGAQVLAKLLPLNLSDMNPVLPVLPNDPMFPVDGLENYPTDTPGIDELQPIDADSASSAYTPWPPDVAAEVGEAQNKPNCKTLRVLFNNPVNTVSSWLTVNTAPYLLTLSGTARMNLPTCTNLRLTQGEYVGNPDSGYAEYFPGQGLGGAPAEPPDGTAFFSWRHQVGPIEDPIERVTFHFNQSIDHFRVIANGGFYTHVPSVSTLTLDASNAPDLFPFLMAFGGFGFTRVSPSETNLVPESFRVTKICLYTENDVIEMDAFYQWRRGEDGNETDVELIEEANPLAGFFVDNSKYADVPPYDPSHRYADRPFTGTGNQFHARMALTDYAGVSANYLFVEVCRQVTSS